MAEALAAGGAVAAAAVAASRPGPHLQCICSSGLDQACVQRLRRLSVVPPISNARNFHARDGGYEKKGVVAWWCWFLVAVVVLVLVVVAVIMVAER